jgi:DNA-binding SARP family transcriptional activator
VVRVWLVGGMRIEVDGRDVPPPPSRRAKSLLAWLSLNPGDHPRSEVAARFWPDVLEASARTSLRGALLELRRTLGPDAECLRTDRTMVGLERESVWVDVLEAARLAAENDLRAALELGTGGDLLAGMDDDWVYEARDEHRERMIEVLETLAERAEAAEDPAEAISLTRRLVALDPLSEDAHRRLIRRLAASGDRAAALAAYDALCERLRRDLGVAPAAETRAIAAELRGSEQAVEAASAEQLALPPGLPVYEGGMIGRDEELDELNAAFDRARQGEARVVLVAGEAGMGKTRLVTEFARTAHARGATVLFGRCDEEALAPYQPWVEALRHLVITAPVDDVRRYAGATAPELARVVPALADRIPGLPEPLRAEPDTERYRLFEAVSGVLGGVAAGAPAVLVLDDLHWADKPTVLLLLHAVRSAAAAPLLVVGTYRENEVGRDHPFTAALTALRRDGAYERLALAGLGESDVAELVGEQRGERFVRALLRETEGNPFFIEEILRNVPTGLDREPALEEAGIPDGVREAVLRSIGRLSEPTREALTLAAIIGSDFGLDLLEEVSERGADELVESLEEAVRTRLVVESPGTVGRYEFRHALIRATLHGELTRTRRARLHLRVAVALEQRAEGDGAPAPYGELAYHFLEAAPLADAEQAIRYSALAADAASSQLAHEEAAGHLRHALRALDDYRVGGRNRLDLLLSLGAAEARAGETDRAREAFQTAASLAQQAGDGEAMAVAALGFAGQPWQSFGEIDEPAIGLLREALDALGPEPTTTRARTLARLTIAMYFAGDTDELEAMANEALAMARSTGDSEAVAAAIEARLYARWHPAGVNDRLESSEELLRIAEAEGRSELAAQALRWRIVPLLELGRMDDAHAEIARHAELARDLGQPYELMYTKVFEAMRAMFTGQFADAGRLAAEILSSEHGRPGADATQFYGLDMLTITFACGGIEQLEQPIREFIDRFPGIPAWWSGIAMIHAATGRSEYPREYLDELAQQRFRGFRRDPNFFPATTWVALACRDAGTADHARDLYEVLKEFEGLANVIGAGGAIWGSVNLYLGMLAGKAGDRETAIGHLESEIAWTRERGARPWTATAQVALAELTGDRAPLEEAAATARELGMAALLSRIEGLAQESAA